MSSQGLTNDQAGGALLLRRLLDNSSPPSPLTPDATRLRQLQLAAALQNQQNTVRKP